MLTIAYGKDAGRRLDLAVVQHQGQRHGATPAKLGQGILGPCKQIGPALEELSDEYAGRVKIVKVNVDENPEQAAALGVRGIPALFMFKGGEVVSNRMGAAPKAALKNWIDESI